jgi:CRISPR-associated exonuclease Cas4
VEVDDYIAISALQHYIFCPRQAGLIHIERQWMNDVATTIGNQLHERVHEEGADLRSGVLVVRALPLVSHQLRIAGVADMVELHGDGITIRRPVPIEVKKGKKKSQLADEVQLCAQALCLEEMYRVKIDHGFVFHAESHRRRKVEISAVLRTNTMDAIDGMRLLFESKKLPWGVTDRRVCAKCSLEPLCLPTSQRRGSEATTYLQRLAEGDD